MERDYGRGVQRIDQVGTYVTSWRRRARMLSTHVEYVARRSSTSICGPGGVIDERVCRQESGWGRHELRGVARSVQPTASSQALGRYFRGIPPRHRSDVTART